VLAFTLVGDIKIEGWSSLMVVVLVTSGLQMLMLGVVGEYLWRNFDETRRRPLYIVDRIVGGSVPDDLANPAPIPSEERPQVGTGV
jgi:hypothetical protein